MPVNCPATKPSSRTGLGPFQSERPTPRPHGSVTNDRILRRSRRGTSRTWRTPPTTSSWWRTSRPPSPSSSARSSPTWGWRKPRSASPPLHRGAHPSGSEPASCFSFSPPVARAKQERLEEAKTQVDKDIAKIEADCAKIKEVMLDLKTQLYAKFGNSINLEAEDE